MPDAPKRRFDSRDFQYIADYILAEKDQRCKDRRDQERQWKEIDRQVAMIAKTDYKRDEQGNIKPGMGWMPEKELPLQAQTLETLTADSRRMSFPDNGAWYRAHSLTSDEYLRRVDFQGLIAGDENDIPSKITQDNADKLVEGVMGYIHEQGEFYKQWDAFNAQAFCYGTGIGRVRNVQKRVFIETARGLAPEEITFPMFFPCDIKRTLLDNKPYHVMHEGHFIGPATIAFKKQQLADLKMAARDGSSDPYDEDGGWMQSKLKGLEGDKDDLVEVIRWEGDLLVPRKQTDNIFIPGAIVTVVVDQGKPRVVRMAFRSRPFSSYLYQPYHVEDISSPYGVGPLQKGEPLQAAATEMFNRLMQAGILSTEPPIQYDPDDPHFALTGGPIVEPRAFWESSADIVVHKIGDPAALMQAYIQCVQHYYDVTGVNAPRLGAQTNSHTTAFAKDVEQSRGQVRTVDYVNSLLDGAMARVLDMQFYMVKDTWGDEPRNVWLPDYGGFARITRDFIPDECVFEIYGSAGPAEKRARVQEQLQALQLVMQIDQLKVQFGLGQPLDYEQVQKTILKEAEFSDVDFLFQSATGAPAGQVGPTPAGPGGPGAPAGDSFTQVAALQALADQQGAG